MKASSKWQKRPLRELVAFNPRHEGTLPDDLDVSFIPMPKVSEKGRDLLAHETRKLGDVARGYTHFRDGDVLLAKITPCMENGKAAVAKNLTNGIGCGTTELHVMRPCSGLLPEWLYFFVWQETFRREAERNMTGSAGQLRVPLSYLKEQRIPVPDSLEKQRQITAKLDQIAKRLSEVSTRLDNVPVVLKRFRMSVLSAACSGQLTEEWRSANRPESAKALLAKIKAARLASASRDVERRKIIEFFSAFPETEGDGRSVPSSWLDCFVGSVGHVCNGSTPSRKQKAYWGGKIPWVSSGEVQNCEVRSTRESITQAGYDNSSVRLLPKGTVLMAMIGEGKTRGQSAILGIEAAINQNIAAIILDHGLIEPKYLWYWLQSRYESTREAGSGSGPQALNCQRVRELPLNLPPLDEQKEVVRRVDDLFARADAMQRRYRKAHVLVEKIMPSILAKAFRGELCAREPRRFYNRARAASGMR
jgi:type I restriction enzyme S subunit